MTGELSHGLPRLITQGNRILRADTAAPAILRGVNRSGMEYSEAAGITQSEIQGITQTWGSTVIRLPFNQAWALGGGEYLHAIDQVIDWAAALGAYTLLDLQWLDADTVYGTLNDSANNPNHVAPLPNPTTLDLWATLAERYREEPAVLFDLFNEPHDRLSDDPHPLYLIGESGTPFESDSTLVSAAEWLPWAAKLTAVIRQIHPDSLIFVSGVDWAFDISRIRLAAANIVYSTHVYPNRPRRRWPAAFGNSAADVPVFVAEWGGGDDDLEWGNRFAAFLHSSPVAGWTAWSWQDNPLLVHGDRPPYLPTLFGSLVQNEIARKP
ncbi:MAG: glycoside hydrolase, family 5 [Candidatus Solibacter sp.]|nr:glycoside hydrolase, family 5 [Candidatus Solibacter sp.]